MARFLAFLLLATLTGSHSAAWQLVTKDALPSDDLSNKCIDALVANISCPQHISTFPSTDYVSASSLEEACTSACRTSLAEYTASLKSQCSEQDVVVWNPNSAEPEHVSVLGTTLFYHFNQKCIKDDQRWCNVWAHEQSGDKEESSAEPSSTTARECDNCAIKQMQLQAGSPDGYDLQPDYKSLTEKCQKTGFPLATTVSSNSPTSVSTAKPQRTCDGDEYIIKESDTCRTVSRSLNVATALLLRDNDLQAFCADFPSEGNRLCIKNKCNVHVVTNDDTCASIAKAAQISQVQLYTWNPILGEACRNIASSVGDTVCLEPPGDEEYTPLKTSTLESTTSTAEPSAAPVPSDIANGTTKHCAQYYRVVTGDYCNKVIVKYSIPLEDFLFLNQGVNQNCTNLFAKESYCIEPAGPIEKYRDHPDYVPPLESVSETPFDSLPEATFTVPRITDLPKKLPLAEETRNDCFLYADGSDLHSDSSWLFDVSECERLVPVWGITLEELQNWNPSLNTSSDNCEMDVKYRYCMKAHREDAPSPAPEDESTAPSATTKSTTSSAIPSSTELPIRDGVVESCKEYKPFLAPHTCQDMLDDNSITIKEFYKWNPPVGAECGNLWPGYRYCVKA
ncbi:hypothetical protein EDB82DRAFT_506277 [Fusarium venenatum]|uniref:uncharacterized protein n=1 Tax=Fusarium venenatum TaxID=56646 RepID=UPI001DE752D1|nr:hypothetical protein EDB82DRAFT_506277 [Fusarium venenatum]